MIIGYGRVCAVFQIIASAEIHLRLEYQRGIVAELVFKPKSETVTVRDIGTCSIAGVDEVPVVKVGSLAAGLLNLLVGVVVEVVAAEVHTAVEEFACGIDSAHIGGGDAVAAAPAALAASHSAAAHSLHHRAGEVVESAVVGVVAVEHEGDLGLVGELACECSSLIAVIA